MVFRYVVEGQKNMVNGIFKYGDRGSIALIESGPIDFLFLTITKN